MPKTRFHSALEDRVLKEVDRLSQEVAGGLCQDFPSYREQTGYIRGLIDALKLCDEIEEDFNK